MTRDPKPPPFWSGLEPPVCGALPPSCAPDIGPDESARCNATCAAGDAATCRDVLDCRRRLINADATLFLSPRDLLSVVRNNNCGPGAFCDPVERRTQSPPLGRPLLGHWGVNILGQFAGNGIQQIGATANGVLNLGLNNGGRLDLQETISEVRTQWISNTDGNLRLQGYYELIIRLDNPAIVGEIGIGIDVLEIEAARVVARMQPYYAPVPITGGSGPCDGCGRRMPDQDMHLVVVSAGLLFDSDTIRRPPSVSGCGWGVIVNCALKNCASETIGGIDVENVDDAEPALAAEIRMSVSRQLTNLDELLYRMTSDAIIGGMLFGRQAAVDAIIDAPMCPLSLNAATRNCDTAGTDTATRRIRDADSIELLRIVGDRAELVGRENR